MQNSAFANITLSVDTHCVSARGNQSDPNSFTWFSFHLSRGVSRFFQLIYAGSSSFFLQPVTSPWFYPMGHVESNISRSISARRLLGPPSLPPSPSLDFHRMHLRGLSPILSCRQLQTRRPITVSNGESLDQGAETLPSCEIARERLDCVHRSFETRVNVTRRLAA